VSFDAILRARDRARLKIASKDLNLGSKDFIQTHPSAFVGAKLEKNFNKTSFITFLSILTVFLVIQTLLEGF